MGLSPTYIALIILAIIYVPIWFWVKFSPKAKEHRLSTWGPAIMIRTTWGLELMGKLGRYKRFWRACGIFSRVVTMFLMIYIMSILIIDLILLPNIIGQKGIGIEYALAIPGINPMLPLVYGWIALIVAMCVHELAHGIQTRANDMDVDSSGLLYGVVPLGAFVEPNEEQLVKAKRRAKMDVYAAGITTNFCLAIACFALMFGAMTAGVTVNHGDNAAIYGTTEVEGSFTMENTSIITAVAYDGEYKTINSLDEYYGYIQEQAEKGHHDFTFKYLYHSNEEKVADGTVHIGVYVNQVVDGSPAHKALIQKGFFIYGMTLYDKDEKEIGTKIVGTSEEWTKVMQSTFPGQHVVVFGEYYDVTAKAYKQYSTDVTLADKNSIGYLGINTSTGGYNYTTPNQLREASLNPFYGRSTLQGYAMGVFSFIGKAFQGFSPVPQATQWWYDSNYVSNDVFWVIVSLLFWIFWLNMVLGVTNALPSVPFDGGFLFAGGIDYIIEKTGEKDEKRREEKVGRIVSSVSMIMIAILILVMFVIIF